MEKKTWTKPNVGLVEFAANNYISTCVTAEGYTIYDFVCDAGTQFGTYGDGGWAGLLWWDSNGIDGLQWESTSNEDGSTTYRDSYISFQGCNETTQTTEANTFFKGWFMPYGTDENGNITNSWADETKTTEVMIWKPTWIDEDGNLQTNWHATNELSITNMAAKS